MSRNDERMALLLEMLSIDSTNGNEEPVADCLAKYLEASGISSKKVVYAADRASLCAEIGDAGPVLAFSGHMDVVSAGDAGKWTSPPFSPTVRDGKLYARGATDMKSGLAALVLAMKELKDDGVSFAGKVRLLATVGEEIGMFGAKQLTDEGYANDVEALIIAEPTGHRIVYAHKGVFTYTVTSRGKNAHSSMPELGVNAIDNLMVFYNRMMDEFSKLTAENEALGKFIYVNSIIGGGQQVNSVPDLASLKANLRTTPEVNNDTVRALLERMVAELNSAVPTMQLELEINQSTLPVFSNVNGKLVQVASGEAEKMFGEKLPLLGAPGGTDAAEFVRGNPDMQVIIFGPGNETMHQVDEHVEVDNFLEMVDLYKKIVMEYFKPL